MRIPTLSINSQKIERMVADLRGAFSLIRVPDLVVLLALPFIVTLLMFVPSNIHDLLVLQTKNPSWWQYFTSNFVHASFEHYAGNLIAYFIFIIPQILILTKINEKQNFFYLLGFLVFSFFLVTLISPVISPGYFQKAQTSEGLSGIDAGILGFIPFILVLFAGNKIGKNLLKDGIFYIFLFFTAFILSIIYLPYTKNILYPGLIFAFLIGCVFFNRNELHEIWKQIRAERIDHPANYCFLLILLFLFFASPLLMFPQNPLINGSFVDILTHYIGYLYGGVCFFFYYRFVPVLKKHFKI